MLADESAEAGAGFGQVFHALYSDFAGTLVGVGIHMAIQELYFEEILPDFVSYDS
jgi:hypothetical protein